MHVYEGAIVCCDPANTVARFLVEDGGRILFVGDQLPERFGAAPRTSLGARALLPAFADTHVHFTSFSLFSAGLDVRAARDFEELGAQVRDFAAGSDERIVLGFGASAHSVAEKRLVSRAELDRFLPDRPVFLVKYDGHACVLNSRMLELLPPSVRGLRGFHADSGELNQEACFAAIDFVTRHVPLLWLLRNLVGGVDRMAARGIGMMHAVEGVGFPRDLDVDLVRFFARGLRGGFQTRLFFQTLEVAKVKRRGLLRVGGCFAAALDGCFGSKDAALGEAYGDEPNNRGVLFYDDARLVAFAKEANRAGLQIELHAIGDAAFDQAVRALAAALEDAPRADHRHTVIHACLPTERGLDLCARHGIALAIQPAFLDWSLEPLDYLERILGGRARRISPLREMADRGIVMSGGSDAPCTLPDPIAGIHAACNHYEPGQSLRVEEALKLFTYNAAWTSFDEKERGSLEAGKVADLAILDRNPLTVETGRLRELKVERLLLRGRPHRPGQGLASLALGGITGFGRGPGSSI